MVTNHQPLVSLYSNPEHTRPARLEHHRLKLQGYCFKVVHQRGTDNSVDYNSRHPLEGKVEDQEYDVLYANAVIDHYLPDAITLNMLQTVQQR